MSASTRVDLSQDTMAETVPKAGGFISILVDGFDMFIALRSQKGGKPSAFAVQIRITELFPNYGGTMRVANDLAQVIESATGAEVEVTELIRSSKHEGE